MAIEPNHIELWDVVVPVHIRQCDKQQFTS